MYEFQLNDILKDLDEISKKIYSLKPEDMYEVTAVNDINEAYAILVCKIYNFKRLSSFPHI